MRLAYRYVMARPLKYPPGQWAQIQAAARADQDRKLLELAAEGLSDKEIATVLCYSVDTIKWEMKNLYRRLGVRNRTHAVAVAIRDGLL